MSPRPLQRRSESDRHSLLTRTFLFSIPHSRRYDTSVTPPSRGIGLCFERRAVQGRIASVLVIVPLFHAIQCFTLAQPSLMPGVVFVCCCAVLCCAAVFRRRHGSWDCSAIVKPAPCSPRFRLWHNQRANPCMRCINSGQLDVARSFPVTSHMQFPHMPGYPQAFEGFDWHASSRQASPTCPQPLQTKNRYRSTCAH